jgi:hypothetical protein
MLNQHERLQSWQFYTKQGKGLIMTEWAADCP